MVIQSWLEHHQAHAGEDRFSQLGQEHFEVGFTAEEKDGPGSCNTFRGT